jgi:hypothetical protein
VEFIEDESPYANATYRRLFEFHVAMGAGQIRIAGDVPHPGNGKRFEWWDRYEAAVNTVWQDFPVWGRCLYDITTAPPAVVDVVGPIQADRHRGVTRVGQPPAASLIIRVCELERHQALPERRWRACRP